MCEHVVFFTAHTYQNARDISMDARHMIKIHFNHKHTQYDLHPHPSDSTPISGFKNLSYYVRSGSCHIYFVCK